VFVTYDRLENRRKRNFRIHAKIAIIRTPAVAYTIDERSGTDWKRLQKYPSPVPIAISATPPELLPEKPPYAPSSSLNSENEVPAEDGPDPWTLKGPFMPIFNQYWLGMVSPL
jgi:hypothetical protein